MSEAVLEFINRTPKDGRDIAVELGIDYYQDHEQLLAMKRKGLVDRVQKGSSWLWFDTSALNVWRNVA